MKPQNPKKYSGLSCNKNINLTMLRVVWGYSWVNRMMGNRSRMVRYWRRMVSCGGWVMGSRRRMMGYRGWVMGNRGRMMGYRGWMMGYRGGMVG